MKVLTLTLYGSLAAGTRQRLMQFVPFFDSENINIEIEPLLGNSYMMSLASGKKQNKIYIIRSYVKRLLILLLRQNYDAVWVQREAFPYLPSFFERLLFVSGKPVIYDFDDAIFHQYDSHRSRFLRWALGRKLEPLLSGAKLAVCGNDYLAAYAGRFCKHIVVVPTVVDTSIYIKRRVGDSSTLVTIGWIGSPSTWVYVRPFVEMLSQLAMEEGLVIKIVGAGPQPVGIPNFEFVDWSETTEISEIQSMDIGIMPLPDELWARGKCGYKLIQYMACEIPVVASPVGVNNKIVEHGIDGFLATEIDDWKNYLKLLVRSPALREEMGVRGRNKIIAEYSLQHYGPKLTQYLREIERE